MNANTNSASPSEPPGSDADRVIDPVDWESRYRAGDIPWDEGYAAPPLIDFMARHPILGEVLVPGSGPGHDVRALATQGRRAQVTGLDLSATAIALARSLSPSGADVSGENYVQGNLFDLPHSWHGRFDWVVEHTCFCAIPPALRSDYVRAITSVLKPNGHYFAIFYLNPTAPVGPPHRTSREEIRQLFTTDFELLDEWLPKEVFEGREGREICQLWRKG